MGEGITEELPTVLVVDDTVDNLQFMSGILQGIYRVKVANSVERALRNRQNLKDSRRIFGW